MEETSISLATSEAIQPQKPFFVLSLDGGGIRGVATAEVLRLMESDLGCPLYDVFDMFIGTSIGALAAMTMVYTKTSAHEICNNLYTRENIDKMMPQSVWDWLLGLIQDRPKYDGKGKRELIDRYLSKHQMYTPNSDKYVMVTAFDVIQNETKFFRSWVPSKISCADAADMSSAAPAYFPTVRCTSAPEEIEYGIDGGLGANNPVDAAYAEALSLAGPGRPIVVISIGTGYGVGHKKKRNKIAVRSMRWGGIQWVTRGGIIDIAMQAGGDVVDYKMTEFTYALKHVYIRVTGALSNSKMDDTSDINIHRLRCAGREWFTKARHKIHFALRGENAKEA